MQKCYAAFLLLLSGSSVSADQRILVDTYVPSDFSPTATTVSVNGAFWAIGTADGLLTLARYNSNGSVAFLRYPDMQYMQSADNFRVYAMPDGGVLTTDVEETTHPGYPACRLRRFDASGNYLWISDAVQPSGLYSDYCNDVFVAASGGIWLFGYFPTIKLNPVDGTQVAEFGISDATALAADTLGDAAYLAGSSGSSPTQLATIWKLTSQGLAWVSSASAAEAGSSFTSVAVAADGTVWAFGTKLGQLFGMHVAANGKRLWTGAVATDVDPAQIVLVTRADGGAATLHWNKNALENQLANSAPEINSFSSTYGRSWSASTGFSLPVGASLTQLEVAALNDDVAAALLYQDNTDANDHFQQTRVGTGLALYATAPEVRRAGAFSLNILPDGSTLSAAGTFERLSRNGVPLAVPQVSAITTAASYDDDAVITADGTTYLIVTNPAVNEFGVSSYSSSGALRWHTAVPNAPSAGGYASALLLMRSNDVCVAGYIGAEIVQCFGLDTGAASPQRVLSSALTYWDSRTQATVTSGDEIVVMYQTADKTMHHALVDAAGNLLHDISPLQPGEAWVGSCQNTNGESEIITSPNSVLQLSADGTRAYSVTTDVPFGSCSLAADGSAIMFGVPTLERLDTAGTRVWQSTTPAGPYSFVWSLRSTADDLYFSLVGYNFFYEGGQQLRSGLVAKLDRATGTIDWSAPVSTISTCGPVLALDANSASVLMLSNWATNSTLFRQFAMSDGRELGSKVEPCDVDQCVLYQVRVVDDGTIRMVHDTTDYYNGSAFELTIMQEDFEKIFASSFEL